MHVERTGTFHLALPPERAFALFTPEGERAWVPGWAPEPLHAPDGSVDRTGAVFRTSADGEDVYWIVLRLDREARLAEYARFAPQSRIGTVRVRCLPAPEGGTTVEVTYALTSVSPAGDSVLESLGDEGYAAMLADWQAKIEQALAAMG